MLIVAIDDVIRIFVDIYGFSNLHREEEEGV